MDSVIKGLNWVWLNWEIVLTAANGLLVSLIAVALLIPGPHPEDWFQAASDFLSKFSRKPKE